MLSLQNPELKTAVPLLIAGFYQNFRFSPIAGVYNVSLVSKNISNGYYYDVIFLPKWRTQIWGKIDLGGHRFEWEAIPKDTDLHSKRTRIWGYINFIGHRFVGRHRFEERTRIWRRTWICWKTQIWGEDTDLRPYMDLSLTYIAKIKINSCICIFFLQFQHVLVPRVLMMDGVWYTTITTFVFV